MILICFVFFLIVGSANAQISLSLATHEREMRQIAPMAQNLYYYHATMANYLESNPSSIADEALAGFNSNYNKTGPWHSERVGNYLVTYIKDDNISKETVSKIKAQLAMSHKGAYSVGIFDNYKYISFAGTEIDDILITGNIMENSPLMLSVVN